MSNGGAKHKEYGPYTNSSGVVYPNIKVYHYAPGTTTPKTVWSDEGKSSPAANPVIGGTTGIVDFYGDGLYRIIIKDENDNVLDDPIDYANVLITADTATLWEGNNGSAFPSAGTANLFQLFALEDGSDNVTALGINEGSGPAFKKLVEFKGDHHLFNGIITKTPWVDIRWYLPTGFVTDGSIDYQGYIQNAINSVIGSSGVGGDAQVGVGAVIYFPPGKWTIGAALSVNNSIRNQNITFQGAGVLATTIYNENTGGANAITVDGDTGDLNYGFAIKDMSVWGNSSSGHGISLSNCVKQISIDRVDIKGHGVDGIAIQDSTTNVNITNCRIRGNSDDGISVFSDSSKVTITATEFRSNITGLELGENVHNVTVTGCYFEGNVAGVSINAPDVSGDMVTSCLIASNSFYNNGRDIVVNNTGGTYFAENINIVSNMFDGTTGTDAIDGTGSALVGTIASVSLMRARNCCVRDNEFRNVTSVNVDACISMESAAESNEIGRNFFPASTTITKLSNASALTDKNFGYVVASDETQYNKNDGRLITNRGLQLGNDADIDISGGVVSVTGSFHVLEGEGTGADNLDTININGDAPAAKDNGYLLILASNDAGAQIILTAAGNIVLNAGGTRILNNPLDTITLLWNNFVSKWVESAFSSNA